MSFEWLSQIFDAILSLFPRRVIIRATHRGVRWGLRGRPKEMRPGWRVFWPLITEAEIFPVARRTVTPTVQNLNTSDRVPVACAGVVVFWINDIIKAYGERNLDIDETIIDLCKAAIVRVVNQWTYDRIAGDLAGAEKDLTTECRRQLRPFGVHIHRAALTDFVQTQPISLMGIPEWGIE